MKETTVQVANFSGPGPQPGVEKLPPRQSERSTAAPQTPATSRAAKTAAGMEVVEGELGLIEAQRVYRLRCQCGRSWFELELTAIAQCPECGKVSVVSL